MRQKADSQRVQLAVVGGIAELGRERLTDFITAPYEAPPSPDVVVRTDEETAIASCSRILDELARRQLIDSRLVAE